MSRFKIKFEYKITIAYLLFGVLWILFSDQLVNMMIRDPDARATMQMIKGWFYVLLTAVFFFFFIKRHLGRLRESEMSLSVRNKELKTAHQELEKEHRTEFCKEKAEESNKLKIAFLNNISHEFRTPMNSILGFTSMLTRSGISNEQRSMFASHIDQSTHQLLNMVTDVMDISQLHLGEVKVYDKLCDVDKLLEENSRLALTKLTGKNIDFRINKEIQVNTILIDSYKLDRIIRHLIDNAIKFTNKGSIILDVKQGNDYLDFTLTDTGIGIPEDIKGLIFDAFRQEELGSTRNYGGSGLGLSIVKAFSDLMGGSLEIESTRDLGTRVSLSLPFRFPEGTAPKINHRIKRNLSNKTILIADDEIFNYYYLKEVLDHLKIKSIFASNGKEVLELFFKTKKIDLILMDIKMPIMDGFEATRRLREHDKDVPVIAQSAYVLEKDNLTKHFTDILPKPILRDDLIKMIEKYID